MIIHRCIEYDLPLCFSNETEMYLTNYPMCSIDFYETQIQQWDDKELKEALSYLNHMYVNDDIGRGIMTGYFYLKATILNLFPERIHILHKMEGLMALK